MKRLVFLLFALLFAVCVNAATLTGKVIKVYDGDTIRVEDEDGGKFKIRFADIDAPEKDQVCGQNAKSFLEKTVLEKKVKVFFKSIDTYGRIVGTIYCDDASINRIMVRNGFAWHYKAYSKDDSFSDLENEARKEKIGIWKEKNPVPPWEYRKEKKKENGK